jgi:ATP-dependent Clp protease ATP-binding subunit ClpA
VYAALAKRASYPVVGPSLVNLDEGVSWDELAAFVEARLAGGEELTPETFKRNLPVRLSDRVAEFAARYRVQLGEDFFVLAEEWARTTVDIDFITAFARLWDPPFDQPPLVEVAGRGELAEVAADALAASPPRSVLLVGETGAGKRTLARAALARLGGGLVVFEATASQFNAGAMYVGELEERVKQLAARLARAQVVWVCPAFEETVYAGQHARNPKGLLDALAPHLRAGELAMIGLLTPSELERILAERPQVSDMFEIVRVRALPEQAAVEVARQTLGRREPPLAASTETLRQAYELAQQFLPHQVAPGNLLRLLTAAAEEAAAAGRLEIESSDCLTAVAAASGLPLALLDPDAPLDLAAVRVFFERRVLGQDHAIDAVRGCPVARRT